MIAIPFVCVIVVFVFLVAFMFGYWLSYKDTTRLMRDDAMFNIRVAAFVAKQDTRNYKALRHLGSRLMNLR